MRDRGPLHASGPGGRRRWTSSGPRTVRTASSTSSRRARRRWSRARHVGHLEEYRLAGKGEVLLERPRRRRAGSRQRHGPRDYRRAGDLGEFRPGEVLVADTTDARLGAGDEEGGRHRHESRRPHLPCRHRRARARHSAPSSARQRDDADLRTGDEVTVSCAEGETRQRLRRAHCRSRSNADRSVAARSSRRRTMMVNIGNPDMAFQTAMLPNDGVGLARMEFIVAEHIRRPSDGACPPRAGHRRAGTRRASPP